MKFVDRTKLTTEAGKARTMRRRLPACLLAVALGATAPVLWNGPVARADEEAPHTISSERVPEAARAVLESEARGSHDVEYLKVGPHEYAAHYTKPYRMRIELRVDTDGRIVSRTETRNQPELKNKREEEEARAAFAREEQERQAGARAVAEQQARESARLARRDPAVAASDPEWHGWHDASERDAYYHQHQEDLDRLEADARREKVVGNPRQMSEEWNASQVFPVGRDRLPQGVRHTFDQQTIGTTNVDFYQYVVGDQSYYSAHYTLAGGQRTETRVDPTGQILGKRSLTAAEDARFTERERQFHERWREPNTDVHPADRTPVVASGQSEKISPDAAPAVVREAVRRESRDGRDVEYYRVNVAGRNNDQYIVGYTEASGRRIHLYVGHDGRVLDRRELREGKEYEVR